MSYLVLARKYRPRTFADVVGQQPVVRALANALDNQRLHHAYLLTGTRGVGKTTLARILAACFNCETGITSTPCGECNACAEIAAGRFMDLIEVDAASRTGVDDTRDLLNNAQFLPGQGRYKVYLIDEVHMLTGHSFNALLKTLEEPPEHVKFLLATTEAKKIPVTVLSRCLQFHLKNMLPEVIEQQLAKVLEAEDIAAQPAALAAIARAAAGSMRDALSITDQAISHGGGAIDVDNVNAMLGIAGRDEVGALLEALSKRDSARLLAAADDLAGRSVDLSAVLAELQRAFHDLAMAAELGTPAAAPYERFQDAFSTEDLQLYYQIALLGGRDLEFAPDPKVGFDMTLIRLASFEPAEDEPATPDAVGNENVVAAMAVPTAAAEMPPEYGGPSAADEGEDTAVHAIAGTVAAPETVAPMTTDERQGTGDDQPSKARAMAWHEVVALMQPAGVTGMILDHSNRIGHDAEHWTILLDEANGSLLNDKQRHEIAGLASRIEGREVRVDFEFGKPPQETPAERRSRLRAQRQAKAEAMLKADPNIRLLLAKFDGRLESAWLQESPPANEGLQA